MRHRQVRIELGGAREGLDRSFMVEREDEPQALVEVRLRLPVAR